MKRSLDFLGYFLVITAGVYLLTNLIRNVDRLPNSTLNVRGFMGLIIATILSSSIVAIISLAWKILLQGGNVFLTFKQAYIIIGKSQISKYLPGNVFQYAGRIVLGRQYQIPLEAIVISTGIETITLVFTGAAIAILGLLLDSNYFFDFPISDLKERELTTAVLLTFSILCLVFIVFKIFLPLPEWVRVRLAYLNIGRIIISALLYIIVFVLYGLSISLLLEMFWGVNLKSHWYQFTWGFAAAWVVGLVTPGAPGGIGIREAILASLYSQELGEGLATGLSLILRVITSLGDLVAFGLAYYLDRLDRT